MDLKETQANWNRLGQKDPLYGVLSHEGKLGGKWDEAEFFATGVAEINGVLEEAKTLGLGVPRGKALDFGCAVGRLSQAMAPHFKSVTGVDIAPSMLELARRYNRFGPKVSYILNETPDLSRFADGEFDFIYTNIVLQHMAPDFALAYVGEFARVLAAGGLLVFQLPEWPQYAALRLALKRLAPKPLLGLYRKLRYGGAAEAAVEIEMNGVEPQRVIQALGSAGAELKLHGGGWYWAQKQKMGA